MKFEEYRRIRSQRDQKFVAAEQELEPLFDLAKQVVRLRLNRGWSQSELAKRVGTKQSNISLLENGLANPSAKFLQKLAKALDRKLDIQLREEVAKTKQPTKSTTGETGDFIAVLNWPQAKHSFEYRSNDYASASVVVREEVM